MKPLLVLCLLCATVALATAPTSVRSAPPKPSEDKAALLETMKLFKQKIKLARKFSQAGEYDVALSQFELALAFNPTSAMTMAEAGFVSFKLGKLDKAEKYTVKAIGRLKDAKLLGMAYYNLGTILEAKGQPYEAMKAYATSLEHRPHDGVAKKLAALQSTSPEPTPSSVVPAPSETEAVATTKGKQRQCDFFPIEGATTQEATCKALEALLGETPEDEATKGTALGFQDCTADSFDMKKGSGAVSDMGIISLYHESDSSEELYLVVAVAGKWYASELLSVYNPGTSGISESAEVEKLELVQLVPGGPEELVVSVSAGRTDSDMYVNETTHSSTSYQLVVGFASGAPEWLLQIPTHASSTLSYITDNDGEFSSPHEDLPKTEGFEVGLTFDEAKGTFTLTPDADTPSWLTAGTYPLGSFPVECLTYTNRVE